MFPILEKALKAGMAVLIMNPNQKYDDTTGENHFSHNEQHCLMVWERFIKPTQFSKIHIVAHSFGGKCLTDIQEIFSSDYYKRVDKVVYTDCKTLPDKRVLTPV